MRRKILASLFLTGMAAAPASAACIYQGVYYEHGTTICFDGWYQECTVADYWSAVGICHARDDTQPVLRHRSPSPQATKVTLLLGSKPQPALSTPKQD